MNRGCVFAMFVSVLVLCTSVAVASEPCETALLVIDMQMDLLAMGGDRLQTVFNQPILESVEGIVAAARASDLPMIYSKYASGPMAATPEMVRSTAPLHLRFRIGLRRRVWSRLRDEFQA